MILGDFKGKPLSLGQKFGSYFFHPFLVFQVYKDNFAVKLVKDWNFIHLAHLRNFKRSFYSAALILSLLILIIISAFIKVLFMSISFRTKKHIVLMCTVSQYCLKNSVFLQKEYYILKSFLMLKDFMVLNDLNFYHQNFL